MAIWPPQAAELIDSSRMSVTKLRAFYERTLSKAKEDGIMVSLHVKATMMKARACKGWGKRGWLGGERVAGEREGGWGERALPQLDVYAQTSPPPFFGI
jgi:hypothetical protein